MRQDQSQLSFEIFRIAKGQASGIVGIAALCFIAFLLAWVILQIAM